jgi:hypothetical protein
MAGPETLDTGQFLTYLYLYTRPHIIAWLVCQAVPKDQTLLKSFFNGSPWFLRGHHRFMPRKKLKRYKKPVSINPEGDKMANKLQIYLFAMAMGLVVALRRICIAWAASAGPRLASLPSLAKQSRQTTPTSTLTRTPIPLATTTTHRDAWPTLLTCLRTSSLSPAARRLMV